MSARTNPPRGTRVKLVHCNDPYTRLLPGTEGTVGMVDDMGTVHVAWDNGAHLGMCPDDGDRYTIVSYPPDPEADRYGGDIEDTRPA